MWSLLNPKETKAEAIIDEAITTFDELIEKVHSKNIENKKTHFKAINNELESKAKELINKVNSL